MRTAVDPIPLAIGCAARCLAVEEWIAVVDSVLNTTGWTIPDLQAEMGRVARTVSAMFDRCDARSQSGTESIVRLRLVAAGFDVDVQPSIGGREHADLRTGSLLIECDGAFGPASHPTPKRLAAHRRIRTVTVRIC